MKHVPKHRKVVGYGCMLGIILFGCLGGVLLLYVGLRLD